MNEPAVTCRTDGACLTVFAQDNNEPPRASLSTDEGASFAAANVLEQVSNDEHTDSATACSPSGAIDCIVVTEVSATPGSSEQAIFVHVDTLQAGGEAPTPSPAVPTASPVEPENPQEEEEDENEQEDGNLGNDDPEFANPQGRNGEGGEGGDSNTGTALGATAAVLSAAAIGVVLVRRRRSSARNGADASEIATWQGGVVVPPQSGAGLKPMPETLGSGTKAPKAVVPSAFARNPAAAGGEPLRGGSDSGVFFRFVSAVSDRFQRFSTASSNLGDTLLRRISFRPVSRDIRTPDV